MPSSRTLPNSVTLFLVLCLASQTATAIQFSTPVTCGAEEQRRVLNYTSGTSCQPRETVVDLKPFIDNMSNVIHAVPDVAIVKRCGGNCVRPSHHCIPITKHKKAIPIMMITPRHRFYESPFRLKMFRTMFYPQIFENFTSQTVISLSYHKGQ
jgi:hypothetical protein